MTGFETVSLVSKREAHKLCKKDDHKHERQRSEHEQHNMETVR